MGRVIYLNGKFVDQHEARISVFDRGFLFGDGIYEVTAVIDGRMIDNDLHLARLNRSVQAIDIALPLSLAQLRQAQTELINKNQLREGVVYIQITRGEAERDFVAPAAILPNLVMFTQVKDLTSNPAIRDGVRVDVAPDSRWARRDIKTIMLLAQVLAKKTAREQGYHEVWLEENGFVTEGASSTAFILSKDNVLITRPNSQAILPGCTRRAVLEIATENSLSIEERLFTIDEAKAAREAFLTSASSFVTPVIGIKADTIADGRPGPVTRRLQEVYLKLARAAVQPSL